MNSKVGIAIYQSKGLFNENLRLAKKNSKFQNYGAGTYRYFPVISTQSEEAVAQINIAHTHNYLRFQYCLDETISLYSVQGCA